MSIACKVKQCLEAFKGVCAHLETSKEEGVEPCLEEFTDEMGRFRIWAGNIAAHRTGQSSLDFRLRDVSRLRDKVLAYLGRLIGALQNGQLCQPDTSSNEFL